MPSADAVGKISVQRSLLSRQNRSLWAGRVKSTSIGMLVPGTPATVTGSDVPTRRSGWSRSQATRSWAWRSATRRAANGGIVDLEDPVEGERGRGRSGLVRSAPLHADELENVGRRRCRDVPVVVGDDERQRRDEPAREVPLVGHERASEQLAPSRRGWLGRAIVARRVRAQAGRQGDHEDRGQCQPGGGDRHRTQRRQAAGGARPGLLAGGSRHELFAELLDVAHRRAPIRARSAPRPRLTRLRTTASDVFPACAMSV